MPMKMHSQWTDRQSNEQTEYDAWKGAVGPQHSELPSPGYTVDRGRWPFTPYTAKVTNVCSFTMWCLVATSPLSLPVMNTKTMLYKPCKCNKNAARCRLTSVVFGIVTINTTWIQCKVRIAQIFELRLCTYCSRYLVLKQTPYDRWFETDVGGISLNILMNLSWRSNVIWIGASWMKVKVVTISPSDPVKTSSY